MERGRIVVRRAAVSAHRDLPAITPPRWGRKARWILDVTQQPVRLTQLPYISFICNTLPRSLCTGAWPGAPRGLPASSDDALPGCSSSAIRVIIKSWDCYIRAESQARDPASVCVCVCASSRQGRQQSVNECVSMRVPVCRLFVCPCEAAPVRRVSHADNRWISHPTRSPAARVFPQELKKNNPKLMIMLLMSNIKQSGACP